MGENIKRLQGEVLISVDLNFCFWYNSPRGARAISFSRFIDHTQLHTTVGGTPLDEGSAQ
jgi:hypothetical protein